MTWTITKVCNICEHYPYHEHCIGCVWDEDKGENTKWELKKNPIVIERAVLDKIRAEIEHEREETYKMFGHALGFDKIATYDKCLGIIDKYKAESEKE